MENGKKQQFEFSTETTELRPQSSICIMEWLVRPCWYRNGLACMDSMLAIGQHGLPTASMLRLARDGQRDRQTTGQTR